MTNDSNIDFQMNSTHNHLQKILFPITAGIILEKCFITVVLYRQVLWGVHRHDKLQCLGVRCFFLGENKQKTFILQDDIFLLT